MATGLRESLIWERKGKGEPFTKQHFEKKNQ
jgi:hypothetical protein